MNNNNMIVFNYKLEYQNENLQNNIPETPESAEVIHPSKYDSNNSNSIEQKLQKLKNLQSSLSELYEDETKYKEMQYLLNEYNEQNKEINGEENDNNVNVDLDENSDISDLEIEGKTILILNHNFINKIQKQEKKY